MPPTAMYMKYIEKGMYIKYIEIGMYIPANIVLRRAMPPTAGTTFFSSACAVCSVCENTVYAPFS